MNTNALAILALALASACASTGHYGEPVSATPAIAATTLLHHPELYDGQALVLEGRIADVCQKKGCWMVIEEGERMLRVTFKDYGFFVPKDSIGRVVRAEGVFAVVDVPVDEARHYLEDQGRHDEALLITAPVRTMTFVASGVELRDA